MQLFKHKKVNLTSFWYISGNSKSKANILIKKLSSILLSWNYVFSGFFKNIYLNSKYYGIQWVVMGLEVFGMLSRPSSFSIWMSPRYTVVYFQNSIFYWNDYIFTVKLLSWKYTAVYLRDVQILKLEGLESMPNTFKPVTTFSIP